MNNARKLAEAVTDYLSQYEVEKVPPGWYNCIELGKMLGVHDRQANNIARRFLKHNEAEARTFRAKAGPFIRPVTYYKFTKGASRALGIK